MYIPSAPESLGPPPIREEASCGAAAAQNTETVNTSEPLAIAPQAMSKGKQVSAIKKPTITRKSRVIDATKSFTDDDVVKASKKILASPRPSSEYEVLCALSVVTGLGMLALMTGTFSAADESTLNYGRKVGREHDNETQNIKGLVASNVIVKCVGIVQKAKSVANMSNKEINNKYSNSANLWSKRLAGSAFKDLKQVYQRKTVGIATAHSMIVDDEDA
ncbi:hypothetical protein JKP88DRAFT_244613 [Tribonema minus]|uniref:Uncharacterized protein n=1 Tax=Tribonema minus TaxID=303371 RepID=A0A836CI91_9STRA|nr:hypothetical protein JKP88DRAFT_244613 [Tribonema minus]